MIQRTLSTPSLAGLLIAPLLSLGPLADAPARAGTIFTVEVEDHRPETPKTELIEIAVEGSSLKMDVPSLDRADPDELIYQGSIPELIFIDHDTLIFMRIEQETVDRISSHADVALRHSRAALTKLPPEQRAAVEKMLEQNLAQSAGPKRLQSRLRKTEEEARLHGYPCVKYEVRQRLRTIREVWVTDWSNIEGGDQGRDSFERTATFFSQMVTSIQELGQGKAPLEEFAFELLAEMDGFPVVIRELNPQDGSLERKLTLLAARTESLDRDRFGLPEGYSPREIFAARP
ncbi:MAG: hypothetical protein AAF560_31585 [Acidobacteriota bacterium]